MSRLVEYSRLEYLHSKLTHIFSRREYSEEMVEFQPVSADEYVVKLVYKFYLSPLELNLIVFIGYHVSERKREKRKDNKRTWNQPTEDICLACV